MNTMTVIIIRDPQETSFLRQRISVLMQRFNAISAKLFFIRTKHQISSHSKRLFLVFVFSHLVLYTLWRTLK